MTNERRHLLLIGFVALCVGAPAALAQESPSAEALRFFETQIRPVLVDRCYQCHSEDNAESGLRLDSRQAILRGGQRGPAIVPGEPKQSLVIRALSHGERLQMPPKEKLPTRQIAAIAQWIAQGAVWPHRERAKAIPDGIREQSDSSLYTEQQRNHWAFQRVVPLEQIQMPEGVLLNPWVASPIDAFILAGLQTHGLTPAPTADKRIMIRRATVDLIGLPPTPEQIDRFLNDDSPTAFAKVVDRLLASPRYGERWGRRWLDVARYADSNGLDENLAFGNAFRYRDYVIASFNQDKPYDLFVREQIAGDLLPVGESNDPHSLRIQRRIATGFLSLGAKMLAEDDPLKMEMDIIDEQVDTIGRAFMGLTLGCARCHDHKFDPIPTADYYALAGVFKSTKTMENFKVVAQWQELPVTSHEAAAAEEHRQLQIAKLQEEIDKTKNTANSAVLDRARRHVGDYLLAAEKKRRIQRSLMGTQPIGNDTQAAKKPGVRLIEAEDFNRGNVKKDFAVYGPDIGVLVNQSQTPNFAEYDIETGDAFPSGVYQLEIRYAAAASRPCKLSLGGTLIKTNVCGGVTGGWHPEQQQWKVECFVELGSGKNVLRLEHPQYFPHIDKLLLAPAPAALGAGELLAAEPLSPDYEVIPALVQQWVRYLDAVGKDTVPVFERWRSFTASEKGNSLTSEPQNLRELARHYQQWFDRVEETTPKKRRPEGQALRQILFDPHGPFAANEALATRFPPTTVAKLNQLQEQKKALDAAKKDIPTTMAVSDGAAQDLRIHIRGNYLTLGAVAPRGFLRAVNHLSQPAISRTSSGRLELARWLTSTRNPLTARVMVNRIWQGHFGEGLVRSVDNFGRLGEPPTHPQLLDGLAARFVQSGWSIKEMHRLIMFSSTYRMSIHGDRKAMNSDAENRLWHRQNRRRLDAESLRDSLLSISGRLDRRMGGSLLPTPNRKYVTSTANVNPEIYETRRRSIYLPIVRSALFDFLQAFDFPDPSVLTGKRQSTTVAPQALFMMNSAFTAEQTRAIAESLLDDASYCDGGRVSRLYQIAYGRRPTAAEINASLDYVHRYQQALTARRPNLTTRRLLAWQSLCRAVISANEFIFVE